MRFPAALGVSFVLLLPVAGLALDCQQAPPARASSAYWDYLATCGCTNVEPLSRASLDYERWLSVCAPSLQSAQEARELAKALHEAEEQHCDGPQETKTVVAEEASPAEPATAAEPPANAAEPAPAVEARGDSAASKPRKP